jgi:beta-glucosidase
MGVLLANVKHCKHALTREQPPTPLASPAPLHSFSVAWTRIVPSGLRGSPVNAAGVKFYKDLITELLKNGITPAITLYHWDLPQALQDKTGGFLANGTAFIDAFEYYADVAFREFGPLVKLWMTCALPGGVGSASLHSLSTVYTPHINHQGNQTTTTHTHHQTQHSFNEPLSICELGHNIGIFAPGVKGGVAGQYKCGHNVLLAHARAYRLYQHKYAAAQGGKISIPLDGKWGYPYDPNSAADKEAADLFMQYQYAWMADPLYFGDYPAAMRNGTTGALLPRFTAEESAALKGSIDYFAMQLYCGYFIRASPPGAELPYVVEHKGPDGEWVGPPSASSWLFTTPTAMRHALVWLDRRYSVDGRKVEFTISENGVSGPGEDVMQPPAVLKDDYRLNYYTSYLDNM